MNKMIPGHKTAIVPALLKGIAGAIAVFAVLTALSYQNQLPVDGKLVIGFPWKFYSEGTGYNPERDEYASFENFEPLKLMGNILVALAIYLVLHLSLRPLFGKNKR
ncbi:MULTISPECIES: hypothetical protein [Sphingobacterium]|uniref:DUF4321 domain-containing protein n=1 Tax=Sphingobacterium ginsenosidimutans TaxID=687845 RepID=A0ABP7ZZX6_9SPHI|nr:hypothetical protein [Sphingobacterium sp. E70]ULT27642.1 hypothetical protein KUH03_13595 [Sphingobacterium sp. E70]